MNYSVYLIFNFCYPYSIQPAPAPPETTTTQATTTQAATTTVCTSVTTWYVNSFGVCVRGDPPDGVTPHESLSDCCPAGVRCCDPCDSSICVDGPPVPTPPPTVSLFFYIVFMCTIVSVLLITTIPY